MTGTRSDDRSAKRDPAGTSSWLALVAHYDTPLAPPSLLVSFRADQEIEIGRGAETRLIGEPNASALRLDLGDAMVSTRHARIANGQIEDAGSRNGTYVNGLRTSAAELRDGDYLEIGRTLLRVGSIGSDRAPALLALAQELRATRMATLSFPMLTQLERARRIAPSKLPVLIVGETGAGKEELARAIHGWSGRAGELVAVNCAAIPTHLAESELFGHRRGAFTGADRDRDGLVAAADHGTLLLDEVDALPLELQPKLLRVLQDKRVRRVGETTEREVDVRLLAATNADLTAAVENGRFRADLLARLCGGIIDVPPLRERLEDLGLLVAELLRRHAADAPSLRITPEAWRVLVRRRWPQNVRELERCLEAAPLLAPAGEPIDAEHVADRVARSGPHADAAPDEPGPTGDAARSPRSPDKPRRRREPAEAEAEVSRLLAQHAGNITRVARDMGVSRMQVYRWMQQLGIEPDGRKRAP